jgi:hypothetical protein
MTPGFSGPIGDQGPATLLKHANELFLQRFNVDVGEVNVEEFYAADLLQLLLYPATDFEAIFQAPSDRLFVVFLIGVKQLQ